MKKIILIISIFLFLSCQNKKNQKTKLNNEKTTDFTTTFLNKKLDSLYNIGVYNGFSATIVDTTGIVYNQGFGYADVSQKIKYTENTIINIASISKVFIGVALLKAKEMKLIDLDDPINKYLPFKVINPNYPNEKITIRQLVTHTSSIVDSDVYMQTDYINKNDISIAENLKEQYGLYYQNPSENWMPLSKYLKELLNKNGKFYNASSFSKRKPGKIYEYSNSGAALCALIIEYATKRPFNEFTKEYIFEPLKMSSTGWFFEEVDSTKYSKLYSDEFELPYYKILSYPDGGLITSSTDLGKFLVESIKGYSGNGKILNSDSYKEFFKSQLKEAAFVKKENYNVGIFLEKELAYDVIGHSGGDPGTNTMMYFNTKSRKGTIFITNTDSHKENSDDVYWEIWRSLGN